MADQISTPGSNGDTSVNESRAGTSKDKACPFCQKAFTSSSLGRHLDLYIKERNPKAADGIHDVVEIRKLRGGITRRQARTSTSRREDSTPAGTPGAQERISPAPEPEGNGRRSPSMMKESGTGDTINHNGKPQFRIGRVGWEATGVMNNIPTTRNAALQNWEGDDRDGIRRQEGRTRSVSKQLLAKTTFEQKQKMIEALDNAKAAELALRELLGSLRAAKQRLDDPLIFDYDPLTLDFPALTLHCLPPPPTLYQSTPLPNPKSWSIIPPGDQQFQALRSHFSSEFRKRRVACAVATTTRSDDLSYSAPLFPDFDDSADLAQRAEAEVTDLEARVSDHLLQMFGHWTSLSTQKRTEIWILEMARSNGRKSEEIQRLKREKELSKQETAHLKLQVDELSRLQYPREFKIVPPSTIPCDSRLINEASEMGLKSTAVGWSLLDRNENLDKTIQRAIGRWKGVVREARSASNPIGLSAQRSLSGEMSTPLQRQSQNHTPAVPQQHTQYPSPTKSNQLSNTNSNRSSNAAAVDDLGSDEDADADADMEDDDSFVDASRRASEAQMAQGANFRLRNSVHDQRSTGMDGLENTSCVGGYVRIGV